MDKYCGAGVRTSIAAKVRMARSSARQLSGKTAERPRVSPHPAAVDGRVVAPADRIPPLVRQCEACPSTIRATRISSGNMVAVPTRAEVEKTAPVTTPARILSLVAKHEASPATIRATRTPSGNIAAGPTWAEIRGGRGL